MSTHSLSTIDSFDISRFGNRLGYPQVHDRRRAEIAQNMRHLQQWLDSGSDSPAAESLKQAASLGRCPPARPRVDSRMTQPVCLITSSGRVSRPVTQEKVMNLADPPMHLTPSDNTKYLGSVRYEPKPVGKRPEGFESFPKPDLYDPNDEVEFNERSEIEAVAEVQTSVKAKRAQSIVSKLREFFEGVH